MSNNEPENLFEELFSNLKRKRAVHKAAITRLVNKLKQFKVENKLNESIFAVNNIVIEKEILFIKELDQQIIDILLKYKIDVSNPDLIDKEINSQVDYGLDLTIELNLFDKYKEKLKEDPIPSVDKLNSTEQFLETVSKLTMNECRLPNVNCDNFSGNEEDKLAFSNFMSKFNSVIGNRSDINNAVKMIYLVGFLKDYAAKVISHLHISEENYDIAINLLNKEFLDKDYIINEYISKILELNPQDGFDAKFVNTKLYINEVRSIIYELKGYGIDFLDSQSSGNVLISAIVFKKLNKAFRSELIHKIGSNYPSINQIFEHYNVIVNTLCSVSTVRPKIVNQKYKVKSNFGEVKEVSNNFNKSSGSLQNFKTTQYNRKTTLVNNNNNNENESSSSHKVNLCKLCQLKSHPLYLCDKYTNSEERIARAKELNLCHLCSGLGHLAKDCFGNSNKLKYNCFNCKQYSHITAFCPNSKSKPNNKSVNSLFISSHQQSDKVYILPTVTFQLLKGNKIVTIRGLIDTGSQRSYISQDVMTSLTDNYSSLHDFNYNIQTFIGVQHRSFKQALLGFKFENQFLNMPFLVDNNLSLSYEVLGVNEALQNFKRQNVKLVDNAFSLNKDQNKFELQALLGIDIIQLFPSFKLVPFMLGNCFEMNGKMIPFGNVQNFLFRKQIQEIDKLMLRNPHESQVESNTISDSIVNYITSPIKSYFHPLESILTNTDIDNGLENLFSVEMLGIPSVTNDDVSSYDEYMINKFKDGIVFRDNCYHVRLPWHEDKIKQVPSNYNISLKVLDRVCSDLEKKNLLSEYDKVFDQQIAEGIIEKISVPEHKKYDYTYIPHRPIIKTATQVTTKIRPVFNCSFKINKNIPSLNQSSYSGIDLMNSLLKLLFIFRTNNIVVLSDIKQAFLSIKLREEYDKNKFCFLWYKNGELVTYRYNTILFGYTASPFILHYIIKFHVQNFPEDKCKKILSSNFFVDNLIYTGNSYTDMKTLYQQTFERMKSGGFFLRSWNTNCDRLKEVFKEDGVYIEHDSSLEKVLGYKCCMYEDSMYISQIEFNDEVNTKRKILSETSKIWDPLGFGLPITVRSKILLKSIWESKYDWDTIISGELLNEWEKLRKDLEQLPEVSFPRQALNEETSYGLNVFTDSSSACYGFVIYGSSDENNKFIFAKSKVAPANPKKLYSIPTLELLGVILALKCLNSILDSYVNIIFEYINICVDSQVVLNWLLTGNPKVKAKYVNNRIKDAQVLINDLKDRYKIKILYHYVHTAQNPADLITRGVNIKKFKEKISFWLQGPEWLSKDLTKWPQFPLLSISPEVKHMTLITNVNINENTFINNNEIVDLFNYSSYDKVMNITKYIFTPFCNVTHNDPNKLALKYWIKKVQIAYYSEEIEFLKKPNKNKVPALVDNLNLFIDKEGLVRSKGRISKCIYFSYEIHNPILLSRYHRLTSLLILKSHEKVLHLGVDTTLIHLRNQGFWVPKGRLAVRKVISDCMLCKKINIRAYKYPKYTDIPKHHMSFITPFKYVGIDYTGHIYVKNENSTTQVKMFILIFTCLNIRAIHVELLPDMSVQNFLLAFQRFCNLYNIPDYIYSDNARTFEKGVDILSKALTSNEFKSELEQNNIKHIKIPVYSAWWGTFWERQIRTLKNCMYKAIGRAKLTYFELLTTLSFIKNAINSRPLTYRTDTNNVEMITPNSFLSSNNNSSLVLREEDSDIWKETDHSTLNKTLDQQEKMYSYFKQLWYEEYLTGLRETYSKLYDNSWENRIQKGELVLIKSINRSRPFWMSGRVLDIVLGHDNKIRAVHLKQSNGQTAYHSICNLYPLELSLSTKLSHDTDDSDSVPVQNVVNPDSDTNIDTNTTRPKRKAALKCEQLIKSKIEDL